MPDISKIVIPQLDGSPGGLYNIKDEVARNMISGGINYVIAWDGNSTPDVTKIPDSVSVVYNGTVYTGTLSVTNADPMSFYLVKDMEGGGSDNFTEYAAVTGANNTKYWETIGHTGEDLSNLGALAYMDSVELDKGNGVNVIGENATLIAQPSNVTFGAHTTANVLGTDVAFTVTDPTYSLTPSKANITIARTTNVSIGTGTTTPVLSALDTTNSTKATFLKSDTTFTRKKIDTATIYGVKSAETSHSVDFSNSVKRRLITIEIPEAQTSTVSGSDLIQSLDTKYLVKSTVRGVSGSSLNTASHITATPSATLETDTFKKVSAITANNSSTNEWKDSTCNLDIHMYSAVTDGSITGADNETLVIGFKTMPSLKLASADTTFAKGNVTGGSGAATFLTGVTADDVNVPVRDAADTDFATGALSTTSTNNGDAVAIGTFTPKSKDLMIPTGDNVRVATGGVAQTAAANTTEGNKTNPGDEVYFSLSGSITAPEIATNSTNVLIPSLITATSNSGDVNVVTEVTDSTAQAYTAVVFESDTALKTLGTITQPTFDASLTADNNGAVLTGVSISKSVAGGVAVASGYIAKQAITALGTATAAAQTVAFDNKDLKKVPLYDDLDIATESHPATRYLNFVTPSGGTIYLYKAGSPTEVNLEYSLDGVNWILWEPDANTGTRSKVVASGDRFYVRNQSTTSTGFSTLEGSSVNVNYYRFAVPDNTEVNGIIESLICRTPELGQMTDASFQYLFYNNKIVGRPIINSKNVTDSGLYRTFQCENNPLNKVEIRSTSYGTNGINNWLNGVGSTGTIYCKQELELTLNSVSGIPSGWTRADI